MKTLSNDDDIVILPDEVKDVDVRKDFRKSNVTSCVKALSDSNNSNEQNGAQREEIHWKMPYQETKRYEKVSGKRSK